MLSENVRPLESALGREMGELPRLPGAEGPVLGVETELAEEGVRLVVDVEVLNIQEVELGPRQRERGVRANLPVVVEVLVSEEATLRDPLNPALDVDAPEDLLAELESSGLQQVEGLYIGVLVVEERVLRRLDEAHFEAGGAEVRPVGERELFLESFLEVSHRLDVGVEHLAELRQGDLQDVRVLECDDLCAVLLRAPGLEQAAG